MVQFNQSTKAIIGKAEFEAMKDGSVFVNTARSVVDPCQQAGLSRAEEVSLMSRP